MRVKYTHKIVGEKPSLDHTEGRRIHITIDWKNWKKIETGIILVAYYFNICVKLMVDVI